jgi:hypothetical protein
MPFNSTPYSDPYDNPGQTEGLGVNAMVPASARIKTRPQGNWMIPQDAQLSPPTDIRPLQSLKDYIYGSEPGRRLMSGVDAVSKAMGGPQGVLGNVGGVAPGASTAITPALEGVLPRATNLLERDAAYFLDKEGTIYDLGQMGRPESSLHPEVLEKVTGVPTTSSSMGPALEKMPGMMTVRNYGGHTTLRSTELPTAEQIDQLSKLKPASVSMDVMSKGRKLSQGYPKLADAIDAMYGFFKK